MYPDFSVRNINGDLELTLNSRNAPELRINRQYIDMMETYSENKHSKEKKPCSCQAEDRFGNGSSMPSNKGRILYVTMQAIMEYQEYFRTGDETKQANDPERYS
jgi:RNA polymerase sigma-54 factor